MRRIPFFWIFIFVIAAGIIYLPSFSKYLRLKRKEIELSREIKYLQGQIERLEEEEHLLKTDVTRLEEVVREELGLVKPGEIVVKVIEEETPEKAPGRTENTRR